VSFLIIIDGAFPPALSRSLPHSQKFAVAQPTHAIISSHHIRALAIDPNS
jgi:hypothetical protein